MKRELWKEENESTFCLAEPTGDGGETRALMDKDAELIWTVEGGRQSF
jgi:hypothetical protein